MLAHLNDYRNPFVTVELLPKYQEPTGIKYGANNTVNVAESKGFRIRCIYSLIKIIFV